MPGDILSKINKIPNVIYLQQKWRKKSCMSTHDLPSQSTQTQRQSNDSLNE